ncbi:hypothetical protein MZD04_gp333 [Pseudomonas phage Psa21]|uniref:Uncharacterized protein n=1 Tax=Pseudomonas phage Psa21 TaxID=2530023 RepID=A0A481W4R7_9CAUD|nr:hypothetical protein MZD04_gp333 [Pseudomonas phage Psa21]QBJ02859.1 hypothetical protein PSA21_333 [Pseudomonas phage Psa21]
MKKFVAVLLMMFSVMTWANKKPDVIIDYKNKEKIAITPHVCEVVEGLVDEVVVKMEKGASDDTLVQLLANLSIKEVADTSTYLSAYMVGSAVPYIRTMLDNPTVLVFMHNHPDRTKAESVAATMRLKCDVQHGTQYEAPRRLYLIKDKSI